MSIRVPEPLKNEKGAALLLATIITVLLMMIAASLAIASTQEFKMAVNREYKKEARYLAEAAVNRAVYEMNVGTAVYMDPTALGSGNYQIEEIRPVDHYVYEITALGTIPKGPQNYIHKTTVRVKPKLPPIFLNALAAPVVDKTNNPDMNPDDVKVLYQHEQSHKAFGTIDKDMKFPDPAATVTNLKEYYRLTPGISPVSTAPNSPFILYYKSVDRRRPIVIDSAIHGQGIILVEGDLVIEKVDFGMNSDDNLAVIVTGTLDLKANPHIRGLFLANEFDGGHTNGRTEVKGSLVVNQGDQKFAGNSAVTYDPDITNEKNLPPGLVFAGVKKEYYITSWQDQ